MAELLGITASIIAVIQITTKVTTECLDFMKTARNAPRELAQVYAGVLSLQDVLEGIVKFVKSQPSSGVSFPAVEKLLKPDGVIESCRKELQTLQQKVQPTITEGKSGGGLFCSKLTKVVRWHFDRAEVSRTLSTLDGFKSTLQLALSTDQTGLAVQGHGNILEIQRSTRNLEDAAQSTQSKAALTEALNWLSPLEFAQVQAEHFHNKRQKGTSTWISRDPTFHRWYSGHYAPSINFLKVTGDPGAGKSVLCSVVINRISHHRRRLRRFHDGLAYLYCQHHERGPQTAENLVGCLIKQLACQNDAAKSVVSSGHQTSFQRGRHLNQLIELLLKVSAIFKRVYLVIDGLDELRADTAAQLQPLWLKLRKLTKQRTCNVHVLTSGRGYAFGPFYLDWAHLDVQTRQEDMRLYVMKYVRRSPTMQDVVDGDRKWEKMIIGKIDSRVGGQFALASSYLSRVAEETTKEDVESVLRDLSPTLIGYYDQTLHRIRESGPRSRLAFQALAWLLKATSAFDTASLCEALAISPSDKQLVHKRKPSIKTIIDACKGFVVVGQETNKVELFHHSLSEHLSSLPDLMEPIQRLPKLTMTYLLYENFVNPCRDSPSIAKRKRDFPLSTYMSSFWPEHVRGTAETELEDEVCHFLGSPNSTSMLQLKLQDVLTDYFVLGDFVGNVDLDSIPSALYVAVSYRLLRTVQSLVSRKHNLDRTTSRGEKYAALHVAVRMDDNDILEQLVQGGANLNVQDRWGLTPLHLALALQLPSKSTILESLLSADAAFDIGDQDGDMAIHAAASHSDLETMKILLTHVTNINAQNARGQTALHVAIRRGEKSIAEMLLKAGADPTIVDSHGMSALKAALACEDFDVVELILGCDSGRFPLLRLERTQGETALKAHQAKIRETERQSALTSHVELYDRAIRKEQEDFLWNFTGDHRKTELKWAALKGNYELLRDLIQGGVRLDRQDDYTGFTALHDAVYANRDAGTVLLLAAGASPNIANSLNRTPQQLAQIFGNKHMADLFENDTWKKKTYGGKTGAEWQQYFR